MIPDPCSLWTHALKKLGVSHRILRCLLDFFLHSSSLSPRQEHWEGWTFPNAGPLEPVDDGGPESCPWCTVHWVNFAVSFLKPGQFYWLYPHRWFILSKLVMFIRKCLTMSLSNRELTTFAWIGDIFLHIFNINPAGSVTCSRITNSLKTSLYSESFPLTFGSPSWSHILFHKPLCLAMDSYWVSLWAAAQTKVWSKNLISKSDEVTAESPQTRWHNSLVRRDGNTGGTSQEVLSNSWIFQSSGFILS